MAIGQYSRQQKQDRDTRLIVIKMCGSFEQENIIDEPREFNSFGELEQYIRHKPKKRFYKPKEPKVSKFKRPKWHSVVYGGGKSYA